MDAPNRDQIVYVDNSQPQPASCTMAQSPLYGNQKAVVEGVLFVTLVKEMVESEQPSKASLGCLCVSVLLLGVTGDFETRPKLVPI